MDLKSDETLSLDLGRALDRLVQQVVAAVHPLRIILFGSAVRGGAGSDSDLDILVVIPDGGNCRRTAQFLHQQLRNVGRPVDILVATPTILEKHRNNIGLIYKTILEEGREIHAA
jgi:predicted nucleotidyltransferase